ncbi:MAG: antibiotic biosynthesis monooxygenase family protein [Candidatus Binataceae bacterium]
MVVAISNFIVNNEEAQELAARFSRRSRKVDEHAGFLGLEVLSRVTRRGTSFLLVTRWTSRDALRAYLTSEDFKAVHQESIEQNADFAVYEVVTN